MLDIYNNIFIQGIKGVGMANLAVILKKMGKNVIGSDLDEHFITDELLSSHNVETITNFDKDSLPENIDLYIYSAAHKATDNPQAQQALQRNIAVIPQTQILDEVMSGFENTIAVAGCHGKTTTSSLLAYALQQLDAHPSYFVGTSTFQDQWAGDYDQTTYFVAEADEYGVYPPKDKTSKFLFLNPSHILCMNIDFDHPDIYKDLEDTKNVFKSFFTKDSVKKIYACIDDEPLFSVIQTLPKDAYLSYGFKQEADLYINSTTINDHSSDFELIYKGDNIGMFSILLSGKHNISNATGVILTLLEFGFNEEDIKIAIQDFTGPKRRFEKVAEENSILLYDDYGHHPTEIYATIQGAKDSFKDRRVIVIFQPHTFSRTNALKQEFVSALSLAETAIIAPIFASARENPSENPITSPDIVKLAQEKGYSTFATYSTKDELLGILRTTVKKQDIIITMGAGDIYKMKNDIIQVMRQVQ